MQNYHQLLYPGDVNDEDRLMDEDVLDGDDASAASSSPGKNGRGRRTNAMLLDGDGDDDDTDDTAQAATTLHIMDGIMRAFPGFLADLKLKTVDESFKQITHMLIDLLQIHAHPSLDRISLTHKSTVERIRTHALDALRVLADVGGAAKLDERIAVIYRGLLPVILARHCADATSVPKGAVAQSELAVELVRYGGAVCVYVIVPLAG